MLLLISSTIGGILGSLIVILVNNIYDKYKPIEKCKPLCDYDNWLPDYMGKDKIIKK